MDEKLKSENMQKEHFSVLQNAPCRSQVFKIFFASGGRGALTPLTKTMRTFSSETANRRRSTVRFSD